MISFLYLFFACGEGEKTSDDTSTAEEIEEVTTDEPAAEPAEESSVCEEDYSFCGSFMMPSDLTGTSRSMAIALYDSLVPAGPPSVTVTEIAVPEVVAGEAYDLEFSPLIATGTYYIFVFLYMEGGGEWAPVSGIDYFGHSEEAIVFDGSPIVFPDINLSLAE